MLGGIVESDVVNAPFQNQVFVGSRVGFRAPEALETFACGLVLQLNLVHEILNASSFDSSSN